MIRRFCHNCRRVTNWIIVPAYGARTGDSQRCMSCGRIKPRYDLRPRSWAGV